MAGAFENSLDKSLEEDSGKFFPILKVQEKLLFFGQERDSMKKKKKVKKERLTILKKLEVTTTMKCQEKK